MDSLIKELNPTDIEMSAKIYNAQGASYEAADDIEGAILSYLHTHLMFSGQPDAHAKALSRLVELWPKVGRPRTCRRGPAGVAAALSGICQLNLSLTARLFATAVILGPVGGFATAQSEPITSEPIWIESVAVELPAPLLGSDVDDIEAAIESSIGGLSYRQFARNSVVAPVRIKLQYIKDADGNRVGHLVHLAMIAHTDIATLKSEATMRNLFSAEGGEGNLLSNEELVRHGVNDGGEDVQYQRVQFELLERVELDCVLRVGVEGSTERQQLNLKVDDRFENRWKSDQGEGDYRGFQGWLHAARVDDGLVFIEARLAFAEPPSWFRGSNFLRSKLPLALQEAAREFRRRLK